MFSFMIDPGEVEPLLPAIFLHSSSYSCNETNSQVLGSAGLWQSLALIRQAFTLSWGNVWTPWHYALALGQGADVKTPDGPQLLKRCSCGGGATAPTTRR